MRGSLANRSDTTPAVLARQVSKCFSLRHNPATSIKQRALGLWHAEHREHVEPFWALRDVSLSIAPGEAVALVGRNGSGKSTFLKMLAGTISPTSGGLYVREGARIGTMIELGIGFHPELTAIENVQLNAAIHGLSTDDIAALMPAVVEYSGLANFMDVPLKNYSSGMYMRLGFAVVANLKPDLMLIDEVFAVGDVDFQRRCMATMQAARDRGCTLLFVSHSTAAVREVCNRVVVFEAGQVVFDGDMDEGLTCYAQLMAADTSSVLPGAESRPRPMAPAERPHRLAMRAPWDALGPWAAAFLARQGLVPANFFLDVGCGSLPVALHVLPGMAPGHYWGLDTDRQLFDAGVRLELAANGVLADRGHFVITPDFDLSSCPYGIDIALAHSCARRYDADTFRQALAAAMGQLAPDGRLFLAIPVDAPAHLDAARLLSERSGSPLVQVEDADHPAGDAVYVMVRPQPAGDLA